MNNPWEAVKALFKTQKQKDAEWVKPYQRHGLGEKEAREKKQGHPDVWPEGVWHPNDDKQLQEQQASRYAATPPLAIFGGSADE